MGLKKDVVYTGVVMFVVGLISGGITLIFNNSAYVMSIISNIFLILFAIWLFILIALAKK